MILLTITAPMREKDWLKGRVTEILDCEYRLWISEVVQSDPLSPLDTTFEQVTGAARMVRLQIMLPRDQAHALMDRLRQGRHPKHIHWMITPLLEQGVF